MEHAHPDESSKSSERFRSQAWTFGVVLLGAVSLMLAIGLVGSWMTSGVQAYMHGEGLWTRAQKKAVIHLNRYAQTGDPSEYARFEDALEVPFAFREARAAMLAPSLDWGRARSGLLRGGSRAHEVTKMIVLLRYLHDTPGIRHAIAVWRRGDARIRALQAEGRALQAQWAAPAPGRAAIQASLQRIDAIDASLTQLEQDFSATMYSWADRLQRMIGIVQLGCALLFLLAGVLFGRHTLRRNRQWKSQLEASEARHRNVVENAQEIIFQVDADGRWTFLNPVWTAVMGTPVDAALGSPFLDAMHPDDRAAYRGALQAVIAGEASEWCDEVRFVTAEGATRHLNVRARNMTAPEGGLGATGTLADITEQKEAQQRLASEQRFTNSAIDSLPGVFAAVTTAGTFRRWNSALETVTGYSADELAQLPPMDLVAEDELEHVTEAIHHGLEQGRTSCETDLVAKDGTRTPYFFSVSRLDIEGEPCLLGMGVNISERVGAEQALAKRERLTRLLYEITTRPGLALGDHLDFALARTADLLGADLAVVSELGPDQTHCTITHCHAPGEHVAPGDAFPLERMYCDLAQREGAVVTVNHVARSPHASHAGYEAFGFESYIGTPVEVDGARYGTISFMSRTPRETPFDDADRLFIELLGEWVAMVLEREQVQTTLQNSQERWRKLVENHPTGIHITVGGTFVYVNPSAAETLGADAPDELIGRSVFEFVRDADQAAFQARKAQLEAGQPTTPMEHVITRLDDEERVMVTQSVPITYKGQSAAQTVIRDITEQHQYEEQLIEAREQAEEVSRLKTALLANMSHEIRTPLTSILGFTDVLVDEVEDAHRQHMEIVHKAGQRLQRTLTSVLDLAQLESETMNLDLKPLDLCDEIRDTVVLFQQQAERKGLALDVSVPSSPVLAELDQGALQRILTNLVSNAIKFTEEGTVRIHLRRSATKVVLAVEDTGIGIASPAQSKIFEAFKQESEGLARDYEGTGLGLSITRRLVELMNGTIALESTKGEGSCFTVAFPRPDVAGALGAATPAGMPALSPSASEAGAHAPDGPRILLVEDDVAVHAIVHLLLESEFGIDIDVAESVSGALQRANATTYDCFLIDINLRSERTGVDLMEALRQQAPYAQAPMVACTAYALPGDRDRFLEAGFDAYLAKPFTRKELLQVMRAALAPAALNQA